MFGGDAGPIYFIEDEKNLLGVIFVHIFAVVQAEQFFRVVAKDYCMGEGKEGEIACQINLVIAFLNLFQNGTVSIRAFLQFREFIQGVFDQIGGVLYSGQLAGLLKGLDGFRTQVV